MLNSIRKNAKSRVFQVPLVVIIFVFIFYFGYNTLSGNASTAAAKVNGVEISFQDYNETYRRMEDFYKETLGGQVSEDILNQLGLKKRAMDLLIDRVILAQQAEALGFEVSDDEINTAIKNQEVFFQNGAFNEDKYRQILSINGYSHAKYKEERRFELLLNKVQDYYRNTAVVTDADAENEFKERNTFVTANYVAFDPAVFAITAQFTEQQVEEFYKAEGEAFRTQEKRSAKYLEFKTEDFLKEVTITEEALASEYSARKSRFYDEEAARQKSLDEVRDELEGILKNEKAANLAERVAYNTLTDLEDSKTKWDDLDFKTTDVVGAAESSESFPDSPDFQKMLFAIGKDSQGAEVMDNDVVYIVAVNELIPSSIPELSEVKDAVEARFRIIEGNRLAREAAESFLAKATAEGWEKALDGTGYKVLTSESFNAKATSIPPLGYSADAPKKFFDAPEAGKVIDTPFEIGGNFNAFSIATVTNPDMGLFPEEMEAIKAELLPAKREEALETNMEQLRENADIELNRQFLNEQ